MYVYSNSYYLRGLLIDFSDYKEVGEGVYVDSNTTAGKIDSLLDVLVVAKERNRRLWDEDPPPVTVIYSSKPENGQKFSPSASFSHATFFGSFLGGFIAVQPGGIQQDILSHELCHALLAEKVGWLRHRFVVPTWFDEGLALQIDYRESFSPRFFYRAAERGILIEEAKDAEFYDQDVAYYNCLAAKEAVQKMLIAYNPEHLTLAAFIRQIDFKSSRPAAR